MSEWTAYGFNPYPRNSPLLWHRLRLRSFCGRQSTDSTDVQRLALAISARTMIMPVFGWYGRWPAFGNTLTRVALG